jgi:hypothetical protein
MKTLEDETDGADGVTEVIRRLLPPPKNVALLQQEVADDYC